MWREKREKLIAGEKLQKLVILWEKLLKKNFYKNNLQTIKKSSI